MTDHDFTLHFQGNQVRWLTQWLKSIMVFYSRLSMWQQFNVAFWNLPNLFDIEGSAIASDLEFTPVNGWDKQAFQDRISNLAEVLRLMFDERGTNLLGLFEIENERVTDILTNVIGRDDYAPVYVDHPGHRYVVDLFRETL